VNDLSWLQKRLRWLGDDWGLLGDYHGYARPGRRLVTGWFVLKSEWTCPVLVTAAKRAHLLAFKYEGRRNVYSKHITPLLPRLRVSQAFRSPVLGDSPRSGVISTRLTRGPNALRPLLGGHPART